MLDKEKLVQYLESEIHQLNKKVVHADKIKAVNLAMISASFDFILRRVEEGKFNVSP